MTTHSIDSIEQWLTLATNGLPKAVGGSTRDEIAAHYADVTDDYVSEGLSLAEAKRRALADLGSAEVVGWGLRDVHLGGQQYGMASAASLLTLILMFGFPILVDRLGLFALPGSPVILYLIYLLLIYVPGIAALRALVNLMEWRFGDTTLHRPFWLIAGGLLTYSVFDVLTQAVYGYSVGMWTGQSLFAVSTTVEAGLAVIVFAGQVAAGIGLLMLAVRLWSQRQVLYGLSLPLTISLTLLAISVVWMALAVVIINHEIVMVLNVFNQLAHMLLWPVLTLLFYRAVYRRQPALPTQIA